MLLRGLRALLATEALLPPDDPYATLDPALAKLLAQLRSAQICVTKFPIKLLRLMGRRVLVPNPASFDRVAKTHDVKISTLGGRIALRLYLPEGEGPFPVLVYFHGGGWVLGSIQESERVCRAIAARTPCLVVSVGYRLAPEYKFPTGLEDCYVATCWVEQNIAQWGGDPHRMGVGGESAGGNLAAAVALMARNREGPSLQLQWLAYPVTNYFTDERVFHDCLDQHYLTLAGAHWFWGHYLHDLEEASNPLASPLLEPNLSSLPAALLVTAEHDPLTPQGHDYARRLREAGVFVESLHYGGMIHGFLNLPEPPVLVDKAFNQIATRLRERLH
jgi:acetyl esterase